LVPFIPQLQEVITEVIGTTDPLDAPDFSTTDYINNLFPTEKSLVSIDDAINRIKTKITRTDDEILVAVREQVSSGSKGKKDLEEAKKTTKELLTKIYQIKDKAEKSEKMVTEITRDIKSLDSGKKNLQKNIATLKRLQMLVQYTDKLKSLVATRQYRQAGELLLAVSSFADHFAEYSNIKKNWRNCP